MAVQLSLMSAIEIFDSRRWTATPADGRRVRSRVPFGASVGCREPVELRDQDDKRYAGLRVHRAAARVNGLIAELSTRQPFTALEQVDLALQPPDRAPTNPDSAPTRLLVSRWYVTGTLAGFSGVPGRRVSWVHMLGSDHGASAFDRRPGCAERILCCAHVGQQRKAKKARLCRLLAAESLMTPTDPLRVWGA